MTKVISKVVVSTEENITPAEVIAQTKGKFFKVTFRKKDGTLRQMVCRKGVVKHLRGGESTTSHIKNLSTVYDTQAKGYRSINLDTVTEIHANGKEYLFD